MRTFLIWAVIAFVSISAQKVSTNGRCGPEFNNRVCKGSSFGDCCSQYGWCGVTSGHCGTGCRPNFGTCSTSGVLTTIRSSTLRTSTIRSTQSSSVAPSSTRTSSTAIASPSTRVSKNARCGNSNGAKDGFTCKGSAYGDCCSQYSYCGSTSAYCGVGCQPGFGTCLGLSSSVQSSSTSSMRSSSTSSVRSFSTSSVQSSSTASDRSSSASSLTRSSVISSSVIPVTSSAGISSSVPAQLSSSTSSSIAVSSSSIVSSSLISFSPSAALSSTATSSVFSTSSPGSSIDPSTSTLSSATYQSGVSSTPSSSISVPGPSVTFTDSASSTLVLSSVTSSLFSASPSPILSVTTTISTQTGVDLASTSVAESVTPVVSTQPSSTPVVVSPVQIVVNPSFEFGDGSDATGWTTERLYIIDAANSGRFQSNPRTGSYAIRGRGQPNGGYDVVLTQTVTVVPGATYKVEVFAKQTTAGFCSVSVYFGSRVLFEFATPGTSYTSLSANVDLPAGDPGQQILYIDGACSLPAGTSPEMYDLFIDDVTMTLVV